MTISSTIDSGTIRDLIRFSDPLGVLSLYVEHNAADRAAPQPTAPLEIRDRISRLTTDLAERDPALQRAISHRFRHSEEEIALLLDPKEHGRGRALFIGVQSGETASIALQIPFRHRVVHAEHPYIRPLVAAHDEGRDAGVLIVSNAGARVLRWSVGEAEELESHRFEVFDEQLGREMRGPSPANPGDYRRGSVHREKFEDRIDANRQRFLRETVGEVVQTAKSRRWDRLVLAGAPKVRSAVRDLIAEADGLRVVVADHSWEDAPAHAIADDLWPLLRSVRRDREQELATRAISRTLAGGAGALGVRGVCDALNEGRVEHLIYDDSLQLEGYRSAEGTLHPDGRDTLTEFDIELRPEPLLLEKMIEKAIETDAAVTPLHPEVARELEEHERVAAVLRW